MKPRLIDLVTLSCTFSLALIVISTSVAMLVGLFDRNVNNEEIFKLLTPAFNTIVGGFIGLVTGIKLGDSNGTK